MSSAFDDLLAEINGTGWYQKRLVYFLLGPLFFVVPFTFLHQIFVYNQNGKIKTFFLNFKKLQIFALHNFNCTKLFCYFLLTTLKIFRSLVYSSRAFGSI